MTFLQQSFDLLDCHTFYAWMPLWRNYTHNMTEESGCNYVSMFSREIRGNGLIFR